jgi:hypothetical protein
MNNARAGYILMEKLQISHTNLHEDLYVSQTTKLLFADG